MNTTQILDQALAKCGGAVGSLQELGRKVDHTHIRRCLYGTQRACDPRQFNGKAKKYAMKYEKTGFKIVDWIAKNFGWDCVVAHKGPMGGHRGFSFILSTKG